MSTYSWWIDDTVNKGRAWKTLSCICSCQLCIKSEACCGDSWKLWRVAGEACNMMENALSILIVIFSIQLQQTEISEWKLFIFQHGCQWCLVPTVGVFECDITHCWSIAVLCMLYKIICNPMHLLNGALPEPYGLVLVTRGALVAHRYTFAPPRCTTGLFFPSQCQTVHLERSCWPHIWWCGTGRFQEQGQCFFYWPMLLNPYYSLLLFFPFSSSCWPLWNLLFPIKRTYFGSRCLISHLVAIICIHPLSHESQWHYKWTQIKLNFTSILVGIFNLGWLTMVTISLRCCFVIVIFSYSHQVRLLALQTLRLAYNIPRRVLVTVVRCLHSMNVPTLCLLYYTLCKLFVIWI